MPAAIRGEGDAATIGRPFRIGVVPIVSVRNLFGFSARDIDDPQMQMPVVQIADAIELDAGLFVMARIAFIGGIRRGFIIGGTRRAETNQPVAVG